jgi:hypothetical protein
MIKLKTSESLQPTHKRIIHTASWHALHFRNFKPFHSIKLLHSLWPLCILSISHIDIIYEQKHMSQIEVTSRYRTSSNLQM